MAEAVVGAAIQVVLQSLLTISREQISLLRDFNRDLEKLRSSFLMVQDFLYDAEMRRPAFNDLAVERWLRTVENIAFDADNVLDEIDYQLRSNRVGMKKKVHSFFSSPRKIKDINGRLGTCNQEARDFGLQTRITGSGSGSSSASMETDSFSTESVVLGRENDVWTIVEMLTTSDEQKLSVLPIVGTGGLGKTTLARKVFGDEEIISRFGDNRVWVYVSKNFDVRSVLKNILTSLTARDEDAYELGTREALLKKLQNNLESKRYLLVLDDHWDGEREKWDGFVNSLSGISSATGNCMIVTTRSQEVASIVKTFPIYELESLSEDDCWSIIKAKAFTKESEDISMEFERVGRNIAKRCQGLPLAAKVVGGLLCYRSIDEWRSIEKNWLSNSRDGNAISKILRMSFDNLLSPSLKKCFAYCSIFPKGYKIRVAKLTQLWMAEGFLQTDQRSDMETIGISYCKLLVKSSLLQVAEMDHHGNVVHCNMHDLVHDLACSVLGENDNVIDDIYRSRYIGHKCSGSKSRYIPKKEARYVRTLFFNGNVSDIRFSHFKSLHTLTLVGEDIDELPTSIRELIHLRYLDISYTRIRYLPDSVGELYYLQTLNARKEKQTPHSYLEKLPDSLNYLISLRHLDIPCHSKLPPEIGRLSSLQTLPYFHVGHEKGHKISELGSLNNLKGMLEIHNLEKVRDKNEAASAYLARKTKLYMLKLVWDESKEAEAHDESVSESLKPHPNLKHLEICGYRGKSLPLWMSKMTVQDDQGFWVGLNSLLEIKLSKWGECEELPMLGHLPHLKSLSLSHLKNVRSIGSTFYNVDNCNKSSNSSYGVCKRDTIVVFRALEWLELSDMPNLIEWAPSEGDQTQLCEVVVFPCLKRLIVKGCKQLMRAPSHFPCLQDLLIREVDSSLPLENICGMKLTSLTFLTIEQIEGLECLPDGLFSNNHNLSKLHIRYCPNMTHLVPCLEGGGASLKELWIMNCPNFRELPGDLNSLNSLESLYMRDCTDLKSIPYLSSGHESQGFTSLRHLYIYNCQGMTNLPIEMLQSCAPSLELLALKGLSSLTNLGRVIECLGEMPHFMYLTIKNVPKLIINSAHHHGEISSLCNSLLSLTMGPWSPDSSWNNVSSNETIDAILQPSHFSLCQLTLYGMDHWDCLPSQLQHLTSLRQLWLDDYGIEALPEWLGNLSSLYRLVISNCKKLRRLPSKEAMQRLTILRTLSIEDCPFLLKERCNNIERRQQLNDSEWPKISHIPIVKLGVVNSPPSPSDPSVKLAADQLASFVAKNGRNFNIERSARQEFRGDTPYKFLFDETCSDYEYYEFRISEEKRALLQTIGISQSR